MQPDLKAAFLLFPLPFLVFLLSVTRPCTHTLSLLNSFYIVSPLLVPAEEEDDAGYLDVAMSEVRHPPPQLSSMPEGLTSHQVHLSGFCLITLSEEHMLPFI